MINPMSAPSPANPQPEAEPHEYELRIQRALRRITRAMELHSRQLSAGSRITGPQLVCLRTVIEGGPMTATAISKEVHVSASTVVGILDRLEDKGLIVRERGRVDRRIVFVSATEAGRQLAQRTPSPLQQRLAQALQAFSDSERATMTRSLEQVADLIESDSGLGQTGAAALAPAQAAHPADDSIAPGSGVLA